ncbi:MAG: SPASM domain-containing protein, partial [archaeon]
QDTPNLILWKKHGIRVNKLFKVLFTILPLVSSKIRLLPSIEQKDLSLICINIYVSSYNGDYLTPDRLVALISHGLDRIIVSNHNTDGKISIELARVLTFLDEHPNYKKYFEYRQELTTLTNRGGLVSIEPEKRRKMSYCIAETHTLTIDVLGNIILCGNDYLGKKRFGNATSDNIIDVWDKAEWKSLRKKLKKGIFELGICKECANN